MRIRVSILALFFINCFSFCAMSQYSNQQIDSLLENSVPELRMSGDFERLKILYKNILKASQKNKYSKGKADAYIGLGNVYFLQGKKKQSIFYIDSAQLSVAHYDNSLQQVKIYGELAKIYVSLEMYDKTIDNCNKALLIIPTLTNENDKRNNLQYIYSIQASAYEKKNDVSSYFYSLEKAYQASANPLIAARIARYYLLYNLHLDSARQYLEMGNKFWETGNFAVYQKAILMRTEGLYQFTVGKYDLATTMYKQAIEILKQIGNNTEQIVTYKMLLDVYKTTSDTAGENEVTAELQLIKDSSAPIDTIEPPLENQLQKKKPAFRPFWAIVIVLLFSSALLMCVSLLKRKSSRKASPL